MTKDNSKEARKRRATQAAERQREYDALSVADKITRAAERRGSSNKEIVRLGVESGVYSGTVEVDGKKFGYHE